jgi:hypothetical protein
VSGELLEKHFNGKTSFYECEARMRHKQGHWVWVLDRGRVATWTDDGKPLLMSGTHQDITTRKSAEVALFEAKKAAVTKPLAEMRDEISAKLYEEEKLRLQKQWIDGLRRKVGLSARILAVFEPRSNTMKLGTMKSQLPWSLESADLSFCHSGGLDWDATQALAPMGSKAVVAGTIDELVQRVVAQAQAGDHIVCMSNGGFGGIHAKLLKALAL